MAIVEKFCDPSLESDTGDGLSGSPWGTLSRAFANVTAGQRINVHRGSYTTASRHQPGAALTLSVDATGQAPIVVRGVENYEADPLVPAHMPIDMQTNGFTLAGDRIVCEYFDLLGSKNSGNFVESSGPNYIRRCGIKCTAAGTTLAVSASSVVSGCVICNTAYGAFSAFGGGVFTGNTFEYGPYASYGLIMGAPSGVAPVSFVGNTILGGSATRKPATFLYSAGDGNSILFYGNSIYRVSYGIYIGIGPSVAHKAAVVAANNIVYDASLYGVEYMGTHPYETSILFSSNAIGGCTSGRYHNVDNAAVYGDVELTADPFVDAANGDFRLNNNAGGGALCRSAGFPTDSDMNDVRDNWLDLGALQSCPPTRRTTSRTTIANTRHVTW